MRGRAGWARPAVLAVAVVVPMLTATPGPAATGTAKATKPGAMQSSSTTAQLPAHAASEGYVLGDSPAPDRASSHASCASGAPVRAYDVAAVAVDITLNRYLDHDPKGRMYVLEQEVAKVRAEEARNAAARASQNRADDGADSIGLQGDAIQPLTLRVHQGECLRVRLRNGLPSGEMASFHLHGSAVQVVGGGPATATNRKALVAPGGRATYEWMVDAREPEGTHYFHSHGDERAQTSHGLFGAVIVEPAGSAWLDPGTAKPITTGWDAIVRPTRGPAFREFALYYHEVGDELYQPLDRHDEFVPQVDPFTKTYRPDGRALNYRSEPFMNRLQLEQTATGRVDESVQYSSYSFGDPATPIMRSYLGDPVKQRVIHAGSEVFHVHHVHGGATRWVRQPGVEATGFATGLSKHPPLHPAVSERTDAQSIGPSETVDIADECGSGGCQQSAGDFMYHCHVTYHYFSGMWGLWRVYNTQQNGAASTDTMPVLAPLPDRTRDIAPAVPAPGLVGRTVSSYGQDTSIKDADLAGWVGAQLPPAGVPRGYDASVWDWQPATFVGEPEDTHVWPGYGSPVPGQRRPLLFDLRTGRLAYPFLSPHLGARPPFAPNHGPAPFLDPAHTGTDPPAPGANGPGSDCPAGTHLRQVPINVINAPLPLDTKGNLVDPLGQLYVLRDQEDAVKADPSKRLPLVIRANAGQDCLDVTLRNELTDTPLDPFDKVSAHIHFVQFDVQASDGVDSGFNYEQTVRPYRAEGATVTRAVPAGVASIAVDSADRLQPGAVIGIGLDRDTEFEVGQVASVNGTTVTFAAPFRHPHGAGEIVSEEFVRYRWYPDAQTGTAFIHDHVNVINSGRHGLFGALIVEPPDATWLDPRTGEPVESGAVADVHTTQPISVDVKGSYREVVALLQDDNPLTTSGESPGSSLGLRVAPLDGRARDPSLVFSSADGRGDPSTQLVEAYLGDPVAVRTLVGASNDVHALHVDGHWFRVEPWDSRSPPADTVNVGISERYDVVIPTAGGPQRMPGDYLYYDARSRELREGSWGLLRVYDGSHTGLQKLPGHEVVPAAATGVCPAGAPRRAFTVDAADAPLPMLDGDKGKVFVLDADRAAVASGKQPPAPLVLHIGVGDCLVVTLRNTTSDGPVTFHADMLAADPDDGGGVAAGTDAAQGVPPGGVHTFTYYASPQVGETTALVRDFGDVVHNPDRGLYGAVVVGPAGSRVLDPATGADASRASAWAVDVIPPTGKPYRDFSLLFQDDDAGLGGHRMPYRRGVDGIVGVNYATAPATPTLRAYAGDAVRLHVLAPSSEQAQVFSLEGHRWPLEPGRAGTPLLSSVQLSATDALTLSLEGGAGGPARVPGDYQYGDARLAYKEAGLWGLLHVAPAHGNEAGLHRLPRARGTGRHTNSRGLPIAVPIAVGAVLGAGSVYVVARRRRRGAASSLSRP